MAPTCRCLVVQACVLLAAGPAVVSPQDAPARSALVSPGRRRTPTSSQAAPRLPHLHVEELLRIGDHVLELAEQLEAEVAEQLGPDPGRRLSCPSLSSAPSGCAADERPMASAGSG